jgi:hypothetical protein
MLCPTLGAIVSSRTYVKDGARSQDNGREVRATEETMKTAAKAAVDFALWRT